MRKKILYIVLLTMVVLTACGNETEEKKEPTRTEQTENKEDSTESSEAKDEDSQSAAGAPNDDEVQEPSNQAESDENQSNKNESTSNKNETTTKPSTGTNNTTTKPSTGSTNNSGSTGNTQNNNTSTTTPSKPAHTHSWTEVRGTVVVQEAWVEDVFGWRTICGKCGIDMTNMTGEELAIHTAIICQSRYSNKYIKIDEIHHPAVTEEQITGYKCECGATKEK